MNQKLGILNLDELGYSLTKKPKEFFVLPSITNFLGQVRADRDPVSISALSVPPFGMGYVPTAEISVDDNVVKASNTEVEYTWFPDRIERTSTFHNLKIQSTLIMPQKFKGILEEISITNTGNFPSKNRASFRLNGRLKVTSEWGSMIPDNQQCRVDVIKTQKGNGYVFRDLQEKGYCVELFSLEPDEFTSINPSPSLYYDLSIESGNAWTNYFCVMFGKDKADCVSQANAALKDTMAIKNNRLFWDEYYSSAFSRDNTNFSGYLPIFETKDNRLRRMYYMSILTALYQHRLSPWSSIRNTYVALSPNAWVTTTFLWDLSLSSSLLAQLDPDVLSNLTERFLSIDLHKWFGLDYITGKPVGYWYASNDYTMHETLMEIYKVKEGGFTEISINGKKLNILLKKCALAWKDGDLDKDGDYIPDYGDIDNNLECVSTYKHGIPALTSSNVYMLRNSSAIERYIGNMKASNFLHEYSQNILMALLGDLNVKDTGFWRCKQPGGSLIEVRHVYDFMTIGKLLPDLLPGDKKKKMLDFFDGEILTETWMHALSPEDHDTLYSTRTDHQSEGAYVAWPSESVLALLKLGNLGSAKKLVYSIADASLQGPYGQAYYADGKETTGGARKASFEATWNDSNALAGGNYFKMIVEGLFGVGLNDKFEIQAKPIISNFDSEAILKNYRFKGSIYNLGSSGIIRKMKA